VIPDQLDFFDKPIPESSRELRRNNDPETSAEAASSVMPELSELQSQVVALVKAYPGRIVRELAELHGDADFRRVGRRLNEVERQGRIRRGEPRVCAYTNRRCTTWWPS
jgi:hypothetical protein